MRLEELGWTDSLETEFEQVCRALEAPEPARVAEEQRGLFRVLTSGGELPAELAGRLRYQAAGPEDLPAVGDWVAVHIRAEEGRATIQHVLSRTSALVRKEAGQTTAAQVLAANLDLVFVLTSLNRDFNLRRIERYLAMVWESGALPVLVLSKADLCDDPSAFCAQAEAVAPGVPVHALSSLTGDGIGALESHLAPARTAALIGSSGVGKSTLVNSLVGRSLQTTKEVRADDDHGRHATTHRQMIALPGGALLIDTPGLREIALWDQEGGIESAFPEVEALMVQCRFNDCGHGNEPGCAVRSALEDGSLDPDRLESYYKLRRELAHVRARQDLGAQAERRRKRKKFARAIRARSKLDERKRWD